MSDQTQKVSGVEFDPNAVQAVQEQVGTSVDTFSAFDTVLDEDQKKAAQIAAGKFDPNSSAVAISTLGAGPLRNIAGYSKPILEAVRVRALGPSQIALHGILAEIDKINFDIPKDNGNKFAWLNPFLGWLKGLETVEHNLDGSEIKVQVAGQKMLERATWFRMIRGKLEDEVPNLYVSAGTGELVVKREQQVLNWMTEASKDPKAFATKMQGELSKHTGIEGVALKTIVANCPKPEFATKVQLQESIVDRMHGRVMDLHEQALFAVYMQPVMLQSEIAAMTAYDTCEKEISQTLPKIRIALAALIAQKDTRDAQDQANQVEKADMQAMDVLAKSLGKTNDSVAGAYQIRQQKIEETRKLVNSVRVQLQRAIDLNAQVGVMYDQALQAYGEIRDSVGKPMSQDELTTPGATA